MVTLTFYGGINEIGGNKVLLEDNGTRIFLDFGMSFGRRALFFEEFLTPRSANGIGDFLTMGLIPDIPGIYRTDLLSHFGREPEEADIQAVLLSHAHADHANYISFLHEETRCNWRDRRGHGKEVPLEYLPPLVPFQNAKEDRSDKSQEYPVSAPSSENHQYH